MPLLGYFVVVGSVLTALLFAADAYIPRAQKLTFASNFDGLPASYKGEPSRRLVSAPRIASTTPVAETTGFALASEASQQASPPVAQQQPAQESAKPQRKVVHKKPRQDDDDWFGGNGRRDTAFGSREPSWRDTWASGAFEQPRETRSNRRNASRGNNDFWPFR